MLARLQQAIVAGIVAIAMAWVALSREYGLAVTALGLLLIGLAHAAFLAFEFVLVYRVNRHDPAPRAGVVTLARAWLAESLVAPRVFYWRQPFRSNVLPDRLDAQAGPGRLRGVVLIHGFVCNRGFWNPWLAQLQRRGQVFSAVNLEPVFASIDAYVPLVEAAVQRVTAATGMAPVLVCHSMGGLAARAWLRACQGDARVHHVITIGSPHRGTWPGRFSHVVNGRQMGLSSPWLAQLEHDEPEQRAKLFTCYYSNCDNIVFPASCATLPGADNRLVVGVAHVELAFDERVMREALAVALDGRDGR